MCNEKCSKLPQHIISLKHKVMKEMKAFDSFDSFAIIYKSEHLIIFYSETYIFLSVFSIFHSYNRHHSAKLIAYYKGIKNNIFHNLNSFTQHIF